MTQCESILAYLKAGHSLTKLESIQRFDCMNLAGRCWDLKQAGHDIRSKMIDLPNGKRIACYSLSLPKGQIDFFGQQKGPCGGSPSGASHATL